MLFASAFGRSLRHADVADQDARSQDHLEASRRAVMLAHRLALLDIGARHVRNYRSHYNPNEPRVPAGHPDGGQWTRDGSRAGVQLAADEKLPLGPHIFSAIMSEAARRAMERYRNSNNLWDLFKRKDGTVSVTTIDGKYFFGSNSTSPTYGSVDRADANKMRDVLMAKYPEMFWLDNPGKMPANAVFHAETTVLLRAAHEVGGSLAGRTLEVFVDNELCNNCKIVLPKVGLELGNPTVTFVDSIGTRFMIRDGAQIK